MAQGESYKDFVEKFKPKKTTDDCYTPAPIMECVNDWVAEKYGLNKSSFVRPFYPGGDYENYDYPAGCAVVDNPPFSVISKIVAFYAWKGIPFFLFAPSLTLMSGKVVYEKACCILTDSNITFENGAVVRCGFITNIETDIILKTEPEFGQRLQVICDRLAREKHRELPKYSYPDHVQTCALAQKYAKYGIEYAVRRKDAIFIRELDAQKSHKKAIFGGGLLLSEKAAAEKAAAEKAAAEKAAAEKAAAEKATAQKVNTHVWRLSEREKRLVALLSGKGDTWNTGSMT